jgi:uncharacterized membrane protein YkoI
MAKKKWRAKKGQQYLCIGYAVGHSFEIKIDTDTRDYLDDCHYENGNYFNPATDIEEAKEIALKKIIYLKKHNDNFNILLNRVLNCMDFY